MVGRKMTWHPLRYRYQMRNEYEIGDLVLVTPDLTLYTYIVTESGCVEQQYIFLDEDDIAFGIIYDICYDDKIPYCQIKFLVGNEIFYLDCHETFTPGLKIINEEKQC